MAKQAPTSHEPTLPAQAHGLPCPCFHPELWERGGKEEGAAVCSDVRPAWDGSGKRGHPVKTREGRKACLGSQCRTGSEEWGDCWGGQVSFWGAKHSRTGRRDPCLCHCHGPVPSVWSERLGHEDSAIPEASPGRRWGLGIRIEMGSDLR